MNSVSATHPRVSPIGRHFQPSGTVKFLKQKPIILSGFKLVNDKEYCPAEKKLPAWLFPEIETFAAEKEPQFYFFEKEIGSDEDKRLYVIQLSRMMDVSGKLAGSIVMIQDFTEARKAEEDRARMKDQLLQSDKMASIGQLAAGVAHEINNPIGFVASNLNRLQEYHNDMIQLIGAYHQLAQDIDVCAAAKKEPISPLIRLREIESDLDVAFLCEDIRLLTQECKDGVDRVRQIVCDLKDFAHPGISKPQYADINRCLDSTVNVLRNEIKYKANLMKDFGELPRILCQPRQLNQVFMNIIVNAVQAIQKNGEIRLTTQQKRDFIEIQISDNGCGIPPGHVKRIFEPFFTTKPVGTGTGLGLHIAYQIIQQHQGHIRVTSQPDQGTTFIIELPIITDNEANSSLQT